MTIQINNQMYKRKLKKYNNKALIVIERQSEHKKQQILKYYKDYNLQLINLDIITRFSEHISRRQFQSKKVKEKYQENCYNYNQQKYITKNCYKSKKQVITVIKMIRN